MIALLFMKGHSERLPNKNIKMFHGKPLLWWILTTLSNVNSISKIVVDTDSPKIEQCIHHYFKDSITILPRFPALKGDHITGNSLIQSMIERVEGDTFLQTHATNPLLTVDSISKAIQSYYKNSNDSLFAVTEYTSPFYTQTGEAINHNPRKIQQSQHATGLYEDNSNLYIFSRESFCRWGRVGQTPLMFPISKLESIDINTEEDWKIAEYMYSKGE